MKTIFLLIIILLSAALSPGLTAGGAEADKLPRLLGAGNEGMDFWLTIPPVLEDEINASNFVGIYVASTVKTPVTVEISARSYKETQTTIANGVIEFRIKTSVAQAYTKGGHDPEYPEDVYPGQAIHVYSKEPVIVYAVVRVLSNSEGFLAVPAYTLGQEYIVSSYPERSSTINLPSISAIVATVDGTSVTFQLGGNQQTTTAKGLKPNDSQTKTLNKGDVWIFSSKGDRSDLSGSRITSSKPVAVVSGNQCAYVPSSNLTCHYLAEMELPTSTWGRTYHASSTPGRRHSSILRIYAREKNTNVYRNGVRIASLPNTKGQLEDSYIETRIADDDSESKSAVIQADKPIGVTMYNAGTTEDGDIFLDSSPFQMSLVPIESYSRELTFSTPSATGTTAFNQNYINLVSALSDKGKIASDVEFGEYAGNKWVWMTVRDKFNDEPTETFTTDIDGVKYGYKTINLPGDGVFRLRAAKPIAAYIYGFSENESYGYPAGALLNDLEKPGDILPPVPAWAAGCYGKIDGQVNDKPDDAATRSNLGLVYMNSDSSFNSDLKVQAFVPGQDYSAGWEINVPDKSKEARSVVTFTDRQGNDTTITLLYYPTILSVSPFDNTYGHIGKGRDSLLHVLLVNGSKKNVSISCLELASATRGFNVEGVQLPIELGPGQARDITIRFHSDLGGQFRDTLRAGDACGGCSDIASLAVSVGDPVIEATDYNFGTVSISAKKTANFMISNKGDEDLKITGYSGPFTPGNVFTISGLPPMSPGNPLTLGPGMSKTFDVTFSPASDMIYTDSIVFTSNATAADNVVLLNGGGTTGVDDPVIFNALNIYPNPANSSVLVNLPVNNGEACTVRIVDIFGRNLAGYDFNNVETQNGQPYKIDISGLTGGLYFVEVVLSDRIVCGKMTVVR